MSRSENKPPPAAVPRKQPEQRRSRQRLEDILSAASALIARTGSDQVKMSDIAASAGISIGSLYQYFPAKGALIRALAERSNAESRRCVEEALADVRDEADLVEAYSRLLDQYHEIMSSEPVMRDIWSGMQADRALMACQLAESRICGALLADAVCKAHPDRDPKEAEDLAFLIWELGEATMRLAISVDPAQGRSLVDAFKRMTIRELSVRPGAAR